MKPLLVVDPSKCDDLELDHLQNDGFEIGDDKYRPGVVSRMFLRCRRGADFLRVSSQVVHEDVPVQR